MQLLLGLSLLASLAAAAELTLRSPKVTISGKAYELPLDKPLDRLLSLGETDTLQLTFQVTEKGTDKAVQPHQSFLRLYDTTTDEQGIIPFRVASNGKVNFELNMAKPPLTLPPSGPTPLKASLIIGSYLHGSAKWDLFDVKIPASEQLAVHPDDALYHTRPDIFHTFRPDEKLPPKFVSASFTLLVFIPWIVLAGMLSQIPHPLPNLSSLHVLPFVTLLAAFEALLVKYWLNLKLGDVLLYGSILAIPTLGVGKRALTALSHQRIGTTPSN